MKLKSLTWRPTVGELMWWVLTAAAATAAILLLAHGYFGPSMLSFVVTAVAWVRWVAEMMSTRCNCTHPFGDHSEHRCHTEGCDCRRFSR